MSALRAEVEAGLARIGYTPAQTLGVMDEIGPVLDKAERETTVRVLRAASDAWRARAQRDGTDMVQQARFRVAADLTADLAQDRADTLNGGRP